MVKLKLLLLFSFIFVLYPLQAKVSYISYSDEIDLVQQKYTGTYSNYNCGAASLEMCLDYLDIKSKAEEIRKEVRPQGGAIYTDEICYYLSDNYIWYTHESIFSKDDILSALEKGIVMLCLDMSLVSGKDYSGVNGHYIVVSGYYMNGGEVYFEVLDPMSSKIKYYKAEEVVESCIAWFPQLYLFEK